MTGKPFGQLGENLAAKQLEKNAYTIIDRNWHCQHGEIDIVAKKGDTWVFCEVKTSKTATHSEAFARINPRKRQKLIAAAHLYIHQNQLEDALWRIDAMAVIFHESHQPLIHHVEDALDW